MRIALILALLVTGCGLQSMAWPVDQSTTVESLDKRYREEVANLATSPNCEVGDPLPGGTYISSVAECYEFHRVWRRYWAARRAIAELHQ